MRVLWTPSEYKDGFVFAIPRSSSTGRGVRNKNSSSSSYRLLHEKKPFRDTLISIWCVNALFCFLFWLFVCVCVRTVTPSENKDGFVFAIPHSSSRRCIILLDGVFVTWIHLRHHMGYCMKRSRFGILCELMFRLKVCLYKQFCHEIWLEPNGTLVPPGLIGRAECRFCVCVCVCTTNTSKFLTDVHVKNGNENPRVGYNVCILDEVKPFLLALS